MKLISSMAFAGLVALTAPAEAADVSLKKSDFVSAHVTTKGDSHVVQGRLSHEAFEKLRALKKTNSTVDIHVGNSHHVVKLKALPSQHDMEFGPFSNSEAQKISAEINSKP